MCYYYYYYLNYFNTIFFYFILFLFIYREAKQNSGPTTDLDKITSELNDKLEKMKIIRLQLAKKNRSIAALQRQIDEVPNRAELAQYQRRFLELYNQGIY